MQIFEQSDPILCLVGDLNLLQKLNWFLLASLQVFKFSRKRREPNLILFSHFYSEGSEP